MSSALKIGIILASLSLSGTLPDSMDLLKVSDNMGASGSANFLMIYGSKESGPDDFLGLISDISLAISSLSVRKNAKECG